MTPLDQYLVEGAAWMGQMTDGSPQVCFVGGGRVCTIKLPDGVESDDPDAMAPYEDEARELLWSMRFDYIVFVRGVDR